MVQLLNIIGSAVTFRYFYPILQSLCVFVNKHLQHVGIEIRDFENQVWSLLQCSYIVISKMNCYFFLF